MAIPKCLGAPLCRFCSRVCLVCSPASVLNANVLGKTDLRRLPELPEKGALARQRFRPGARNPCTPPFRRPSKRRGWDSNPRTTERPSTVFEILRDGPRLSCEEAACALHGFRRAPPRFGTPPRAFSSARYSVAARRLSRAFGLSSAAANQPWPYGSFRLDASTALP